MYKLLKKLQYIHYSSFISKQKSPWIQMSNTRRIKGNTRSTQADCRNLILYGIIWFLKKRFVKSQTSHRVVGHVVFLGLRPRNEGPGQRLGIHLLLSRMQSTDCATYRCRHTEMYTSLHRNQIKHCILHISVLHMPQLRLGLCRALGGRRPRRSLGRERGGRLGTGWGERNI